MTTSTGIPEKDRAMHRNPSRTPWVFVGMLVALAALVAPASRATVVSVSPADTSVTIGDVITLRVVTTAFADLKGYQLLFGFDPTIVELQGISPGDVLTGTGRAYAGYPVPDPVAPADTAWYDAAMLDGSTAGPGVLAYFTFKALALGTTTVECRTVDFRDSQNLQTLPSCESGVVNVLPPTSARSASWGRLKAIYR